MLRKQLVFSLLFLLFSSGIVHADEPFHYQYEPEKLYNILQMSEAEFEKQWKSGKTIKEIGEANGIDEQTIIIALSKDQFKQLNAALKTNKITYDYYCDYAMSMMKDDILSFVHSSTKKDEETTTNKPLKTLTGETKSWKGTVEFVEENGEVKSYTTVQPIGETSSDHIISVDTLLGNNLKTYDVKDIKAVEKDITFATIEVKWKENNENKKETIVVKGN
ncbi:hypothetical protein [Metabacillus iocasae]|uniref:Secreted protein n=1 Tax=Priestia iocasae TaxID=2291674 RepID=A0ABS2QUA3_9BACI|nr:hypothetical protein [Metabacillus iocasae]MBM7703060.1 hypothetical protein [Metabacillus iocasae]